MFDLSNGSDLYLDGNPIQAASRIDTRRTGYQEHSMSLSCPLRLLSPQDYSQRLKDHRGTYLTNYDDQVLFVWDHSKNCITMPLSKSSNIGIVRSATGSGGGNHSFHLDRSREMPIDLSIQILVEPVMLQLLLTRCFRDACCSST
jgi:hypothetical protein